MIKLLVPLGLLGLLSILVLILIYIIRPNYQTKYISSTQIWVDSLRYRKKRLNTNTLRNVLLFICQVLILTSIAVALAQPVIDKRSEEVDVIAIVDSSASMMTEVNGVTRYERALTAVEKLIETTARNDSKNKTKISVIIADDSPRYLGIRYESSRSSELISMIRELKEENSCTYASANVKQALDSCKSLMDESHENEIYFYTDVQYIGDIPDEVKVMTDEVLGEKEWNAAILDAYAVKTDNFYNIYVDVASYGEMPRLSLNVKVTKPNGAEDIFSTPVELDDGVTKHVVFYLPDGSENPSGGAGDSIYDGEGNYIYSQIPAASKFSAFEELEITLSGMDGLTPGDSFAADDTFYVYGGNPEVIKILYASDDPCRFFQIGLANIRNNNKLYDIEITEVNTVIQTDVPITSGYDFYVFEDTTGEVKVDMLPVDGVSFFVEPTSSSLPPETGVSIANSISGKFTPTLNKDFTNFPMLADTNLENLYITKYNALIVPQEQKGNWNQLLTVDNTPGLLTRKDGKNNCVIMPFGVHFSNFPRIREWPVFLNNMFNYYFPNTITKYVFDVGENIQLNSRAKSVAVLSAKDIESGITDPEEVIDKFPYTLKYSVPGKYVIKQTSVYDKPMQDVSFYVKMPAGESDILKVETFPDFYSEVTEKKNFEGLWIWLAAALEALLLAEWWLHYRESK